MIYEIVTIIHRDEVQVASEGSVPAYGGKKKSNRRVARRNYNSNSTNLFTGNGQLKWSPAFATGTPSSGFPQFNQMNLHAMAHTHMAAPMPNS